MSNRRQFLTVLGVAAVGMPAAAWWGAPTAAPVHGAFALTLADEEWRRRLTPQAYAVLRGRATERPFTSALNHEHRHGTFHCAGCGHPLFSSSARFESGTGWPSFWRALDGAARTSVDTSWWMVRTEVHCAQCGSHLGHLFSDGPKPTGLRYCINGVALRFEAA